jgi:glycosyltransferase involved in cell wall biosynthesis
MKISIVTVIKNRKHYVEKFVDNVRNQGCDDFEHIVVDGASTDGTLEKLKQYPHLRVISRPDKGSVYALNTGLSLISGEIFGWLNSDEQYHNGVLKLVCKKFGDEPSIDVISGGFDIVTTSGVVIRRSKGADHGPRKRMIGYNSLVPSCVFIRTSALDKVGRNVDEKLLHCYDHELYTRLRINCRWLHMSEVFSRFEIHQGSGVISNPSLAINEIRSHRIKYRRNFSSLGFWIRCFIFDNYMRLFLMTRWRACQKAAK